LSLDRGKDAPPLTMKATDLDTPLVLAEESLIWRLGDGRD
jgi:hypothetical protein